MFILWRQKKEKEEARILQKNSAKIGGHQLLILKVGL
jgi:hypothetical protein